MFVTDKYVLRYMNVVVLSTQFKPTTFTNVGDKTAYIEASDNGIDWVELVTLSSNSSTQIEVTHKYLQLVSDTLVYAYNHVKDNFTHDVTKPQPNKQDNPVTDTSTTHQSEIEAYKLLISLLLGEAIQGDILDSHINVLKEFPRNILPLITLTKEFNHELGLVFIKVVINYPSEVAYNMYNIVPTFIGQKPARSHTSVNKEYPPKEVPEEITLMFVHRETNEQIGDTLTLKVPEEFSN